MANDWKNVQYKDGKYRTSEGGGGGSSTFAGLDDVNFANIQNGQVPKYNSETRKWENANESGGGGTVTDVTVDGTSVVNPQGVAEIETPNAGGIEYDNQQSGLQATNMQDAIDELAQGGGGGGVEDVEVNGTSVVNSQNVAEITSYKEVTQAEYQALPSSKLTDNILYCIKDSAGADGFPPLIYSDEEREIGVWTDGRPLYQKTVHWTGSLNNGQNITIDSNINLSNVGIFVSDIAFLKFSGYSYATSSINGKVLDVELVNQGVMIENFTGFTIIEILVTYRYTKTTDTPGSGTWNQQGGYAHHYSTTEQVVGTWINGKPIYELSVRGLNVSLTDTWKTLIDMTSCNVDEIIHTDALGTYSGTKCSIVGVNAGQVAYINGYLQSYKLRDNANVSAAIVQYTKTTD